MHHFIVSKNLVPEEVCDTIVSTWGQGNLNPSPVFSKDKHNPVKRNSSQLWIPQDNWVAMLLKGYMLDANSKVFKFKLTQWSEDIQYTVYDKDGHYEWHKDYLPTRFRNEFRKLSISFMLTHPGDCEGGEFQIRDDEVKTIPLKKGQAVIFPSVLEHRVKPVLSGKRISLVGWYGGPDFA